MAPRKRYTEEQRQEAREMYESGEFNKAQIAREIGCSVPGITKWAKKHGWVNPELSVMSEAAERSVVARQLTLEQNKEALAESLSVLAFEVIARIRGHVPDNASDELRHALGIPVYGITNIGFEHATVDRPSPADEKHLTTSLGILVDKLQVLSGGATSRIETLTDVPEVVAEKWEKMQAMLERTKLSEAEDEAVANGEVTRIGGN